MILVRELRVDYDEVCAVNDLCLDIPAGEIYGLIGPNGAGKTTTLLALTGLLEPTYGDIHLNGIDLGLYREEAIRVVGFMPDSVPVYEDLTVREYLDLFAASYRIPPGSRKAIVDQYLALVELSEKADAMTTGLSRGMRQRLLLAKTLLPEPRIVLLDEPASGMDPHGRILLKQILRRLASEGKTVLISSHILTELSEFCTSVGIMEKGRMVLTGRVEEIAAGMPNRHEVRVEVIIGEDACAKILAEYPGVGELCREGRVFTFTFAGDDAATGELLAVLVAAGVRVIAFGRQKDDLEALFLKVGAKEVS